MPLFVVRTEARGIFARSPADSVSACLTAPVTWMDGCTSCAGASPAAKIPKTNQRRVCMTSSHCSVRLEVDFSNKLEDAGITRAGDRTESRASEASVGIIQRRRVRHIESFRAEFEVHALRDTERLSEHQIRILKSRSANRIARAGSNHKLGRRRECRGVEVPGHTAAIKLVGSADSVGPLNSKT